MPVRVPILQVPGWRGFPGLRHGFLGRQGGVSTGPFASLNLGRHTEDDPGAVTRNWALLEGLVPGMKCITMRQVHGSQIVRASGELQSVGDADGMYTDVPGLLLGVLTADCVPVLIIAPTARAAAAVHAGWRGTLAGVVPKAVQEICLALRVRPSDLRITLGPSIGPCCYEVETVIGEIFLNDCVMQPESCHRSNACTVHRVWERARNQLRETLREASFSKLLQEDSCLDPLLETELKKKQAC